MSARSLDFLLSRNDVERAERFHQLVKTDFRPGNRADFVSVIQRAVRKYGLSVAELADGLGACQATVKRWVDGVTAPARHSRRPVAMQIAEMVIRAEDRCVASEPTIDFEAQDAVSQIASAIVRESAGA